MSYIECPIPGCLERLTLTEKGEYRHRFTGCGLDGNTYEAGALEKIKGAFALKDAETQSLKKRLFIKARQPEPKGYSDKELEEMFGPYLYKGDTAGLGPREVSLLDALMATRSELDQALDD